MKKLSAIFLTAGAALAVPALAETEVDRIVVYDISAPSVTYTEPRIIVTPPLTEDQLTTRDVMQRLANDNMLRGRIGVETFHDSVTLTGRVMTPWQADRAGSIAQNTPGVRMVSNEIHATMQG